MICNPSLKHIRGVNIEMYADDTILYSSSWDVSIATSQCEEALKQLSAWCINNKLTINTKITKVMSIARNDAAKEKMDAVDVKLAGDLWVRLKLINI